MTTLAGSEPAAWADGMASQASFMSLYDISMDSAGSLYVTDIYWIRKIQTVSSCNAGYYFEGTACVLVSAGYYSTGSGMSFACAGGYFSSSAGASACAWCDGMFSPAGSSGCSSSSCMAGHYMNSSGSCLVCPAGTYSSGGSSAGCTLAPIGGWLHAAAVLFFLCVCVCVCVWMMGFMLHVVRLLHSREWIKQLFFNMCHCCCSRSCLVFFCRLD